MFNTWEDVKKNEIDYWLDENCVLEEFVVMEVKNFDDIKVIIKNHVFDEEVAEEFTYNEEKWLNEIYEAVKPAIIKFLSRLVAYVSKFWEDNAGDSIEVTHRE